MNLNETDSAVKAKKALQVSYTQIYQTQNCILKEKKALKWVQGELLKAMKADCEVHPKKKKTKFSILDERMKE